MNRILAALDTSSHGTTVMEYALFIAGVFRCGLTALTVVETKKIEGPMLRDYLATVGLEAGLDYRGKVERFLEMRSREILESCESRCRDAGIPFTGICRKGIPSRIIASMVDEVDLILLGRKGEHAEWHAYPLGGSVEATIRTTRKPVLVTPKRFTPIQKALVAYDGSAYAKDALTMAATICRETRMQGVVLAVQAQTDEEAARVVREEVDAILRENGASCEFVVRIGDAAAQIAAVATGMGCDLVVMGAYGHSKIREMLLGSTTEQVLLNIPDLPILLRR